MKRLLPLLSVFALAGCDGCGKEKPYTPFGVVSGEPSASVASDDAEAPEPDAATEKRFVVKVAEPAPSTALTRWTLGDRSIDAPAQRVFERGLAADFDADGKNEIVAWTLPAPGAPATAAPGELWLFPGTGPAKKLAALPGFVPSGPACKPTPALMQTGPKSVTLDVSAKCQAALLPRAPTRAILVLAPLAERPLVVGLRASEPAPGEKLGLDVDSTDRDGDGRDDVRLSVSVAHGSEHPALAQLVWLDRAAGASREASEPAGSIGKLAANEAWRSKKKKSSAPVRTSVANIRRLLASLCEEGGVPRVFELEGAALSCAPLGPVVDRLLEAEVQSSLADGDALSAFAAFGRDGWYFGKASDKTKKSLEKALLGAVKSVEKPELVNVGARPAPRGKSPRMSPLAFESSGDLLVETAHDVVRVGKSGEEALGEAGSPWPLEIARADGARLGQAYAPCDAAEIALAWVGANGATLTPTPLELLAPRPGNCAGHASSAALGVAPLAWKGDALEALLAGEPIGPRSSAGEAAMRPRVMGSARSPDGRLLATPTALGVLVVGGDKPLLFATGPGPFEDCTVADKASAVACTQGGAVKLFRSP